MLRIEFNPLLSDVTGLASVLDVVNLQVFDNAALATFTSMSALTTVKSDLQVSRNGALTTLAFPALTLVGEGTGPVLGLGDIRLDSNPSLSSVGFPVLTEVDSELAILNSGSLVDLNGFSALTSSIWNLNLMNNTGLRDVTGLNSLGDTGTPPAATDFRITGNVGLTDALALALAALIETNNPAPTDDLPFKVISGNN